MQVKHKIMGGKTQFEREINCFNLLCSHLVWVWGLLFPVCQKWLSKTARPPKVKSWMLSGEISFHPIFLVMTGTRQPYFWPFIIIDLWRFQFHGIKEFISMPSCLLEIYFYFIFSCLWDAGCVDVAQRRNWALAVDSSWQYSDRSLAIKACATENLDMSSENGNMYSRK